MKRNAATSSIHEFLSSLWSAVRENWTDFLAGTFLGVALFLIATPFLVACRILGYYVLDLLPASLIVSLLAASQRKLELTGMFLVLLVIAAPYLLHFAVRAWASWYDGLFKGWLLVPLVSTTLILANWHRTSVACAGVLLLLAPVGFKVFRSKRPNSELRLCIETESKWTPIDLTRHSDNPVTNWRDDRFQRGGFVREVATRILLQNPPVLGIIGKFGQGKSSVLNLLRISLSDRTDAVVVPFNTWIAGDKDSLPAVLFETVLSEIQNRYLVPRMPRGVRTYLRLLSLPKSPINTDVLFAEPPLNRTVEQLREVFRKLPFRVIVLIDEMDRLDSVDLAAVFRLLRGVPDIPNLTFVCAFNREHLVLQIGGGNGTFAKDYIDKFLPIQLPLPKIDEDCLEELFDYNIDVLSERHKLFRNEKARNSFSERLGQTWNSIARRELDNVRIMGELFRNLDSALNIIREEVDPYELLIIETVRTLIPEAYEFVYRNGPHFYRPGSSMRHWGELGLDKDEIKKKRKAIFDPFFDALPAGQKSTALGLLSSVFPIVAEYSESLWMSSPEDPDSEKRHIYDAAFFYRYFIYGVPKSIYGQREIRTFVESMNLAASEVAGVSVFRRELERLSENALKTQDFWNRLSDFVLRMNGNQQRAVCWAIAEMSSKLSRDFFGSGEFSRARLAVFTVVGRLADGPEAQSLMEKMIRVSDSDELAMDMWFYATPEKVSELVRDFGHIDVQRLKQVFVERMRKKFSHHDGVTPDFTSMRVFALLQWLLIAPEDKVLLSEYWRRVFAHNPKLVDAYIEFLFPAGSSYSEDARPLIEKFFPVAELDLLLEKRLAGGDLDDTTRRAIERYRAGGRTGE